MKSNNAAFPFVTQNNTIEYGLTTRDYIAIEAMKGLISNSSVFLKWTAEEIAEEAYLQADTLLRESEKGK